MPWDSLQLNFFNINYFHERIFVAFFAENLGV